MIGIAIKCYIATSTLMGWYTGIEVHDYAGQSAGRAVEGYDYGDILFAFDGMKMRVNSNDCLYLEDPVKAYDRVLRQKQAFKQAVAVKKQEIDKITVGNKPWCIVDGYGRRKCHYNTLAECLEKQNKVDRCELKNVEFVD